MLSYHLCKAGNPHKAQRWTKDLPEAWRKINWFNNYHWRSKKRRHPEHLTNPPWFLGRFGWTPLLRHVKDKSGVSLLHRCVCTFICEECVSFFSILFLSYCFFHWPMSSAFFVMSSVCVVIFLMMFLLQHQTMLPPLHTRPQCVNQSLCSGVCQGERPQRENKFL